MNKTISISLLALTLLGSPVAMSAAPQGKPGNCQASPLREAILSGALTDSELKTLQADRSAIRARYRALRQSGGALDDKARAELNTLHEQLRTKATALATNAERGPARSALPANFCGPRGGKHHGRMQPPAGLNAEQQAQWEKDRAALRAKVQAARADGQVSEQERSDIRAQRDAMQRKYHAASEAK